MIQGLYPILYIMSAYINDFTLIVIGALVIFGTFMLAWIEHQDPTKQNRSLSERLPMPFEDPDAAVRQQVLDIRNREAQPVVLAQQAIPRPLQDEDPCHVDWGA